MLRMKVISPILILVAVTFGVNVNSQTLDGDVAVSLTETLFERLHNLELGLRETLVEFKLHQETATGGSYAAITSTLFVEHVEGAIDGVQDVSALLALISRTSAHEEIYDFVVPMTLVWEIESERFKLIEEHVALSIKSRRIFDEIEEPSNAPAAKVLMERLRTSLSQQ